VLQGKIVCDIQPGLPEEVSGGASRGYQEEVKGSFPYAADEVCKASLGAKGVFAGIQQTNANAVRGVFFSV
jgi:hypothetical protein